MKNKLMIVNILLLIPAMILTMNLPTDVLEDLDRATSNAHYNLEKLYSDKGKSSKFHIDLACGSITDALHMIEYANSIKNTVTPEKVGRISDENMKIIKRNFFNQIQNKSQTMAKETINKYAKGQRFEQAAQLISMQNKLCKEIIRPEDCDCAAIDAHLKKLLKNEIDKKYESLEQDILAEPQRLKNNIRQARRASKARILTNKKAQEDLHKIWNQL